MNRDLLIAELERYQPGDRQQEQARLEVVAFVRTHAKFWSRDCPPGHVTASAWVCDEKQEQVVLVHHGKIRRWLQPGGHVEPEDGEIWCTALREAQEETGLRRLEVRPGIFDVDVHWIDERPGEPGHLHLDVRYLVLGDPGEPLTLTKESREVAWFPIDELLTSRDRSTARMACRTRVLRNLSARARP